MGFGISFDKFYPNPRLALAQRGDVLAEGTDPHAGNPFAAEGGVTLPEQLPGIYGERLENGRYTLIAMGKGLPAYGRFLKVWEE